MQNMPFLFPQEWLQFLLYSLCLILMNILFVQNIFMAEL